MWLDACARQQPFDVFYWFLYSLSLWFVFFEKGSHILICVPSYPFLMKLFTYKKKLFNQLSDWVIVLQWTSIALNIPLSFISVILLPLVGNAVDHASAITFAMKDKLVSFLAFTFNSFFFRMSSNNLSFSTGHNIRSLNRIINADSFVCGRY